MFLVGDAGDARALSFDWSPRETKERRKDNEVPLVLLRRVPSELLLPVVRLGENIT